MIRAYSEIVQFQVTNSIKEFVAELIQCEKTMGLTTAEAVELDEFLRLEHLMRMAKRK